MQLTENRYKNRRLVISHINEINANGFKKCKEAGWLSSIRADDIHIADRLTDRKFPAKEFSEILENVVTDYDEQILQMCEDYMAGKGKPLRIQAYGNNSLMIGIRLKVFDNHKCFHLVLHTCYKEQRSATRQRTINHVKLWTKGEPKQLSDNE